MTLASGPLDCHFPGSTDTEHVMADGVVALTQFFVGSVQADGDDDMLRVLSPLRYTFREALEDQAQLDPEGGHTAVLWVRRTFSPASFDLLESHRKRAKQAREEAQ